MPSCLVNVEHCLHQSVDPRRQHPGHQGERPAAAGEAQQRLEEGVRGTGDVSALPEGRPLLENEDGGRQHTTPASPAEPEPEPEPESESESEPAAAAAGGKREDGEAGADGRGRVQHLLHQQRAGPTCRLTDASFNVGLFLKSRFLQFSFQK